MNFFYNLYIPIDFLKGENDQQYKTILIGNLSRYCCIYKVNQIIFYNVDVNWKTKAFDMKLARDVLEYLNTPQYLRKYRFGQIKTLKYAGILPPLNTPNHPTQKGNPEEIFKGDKIYYRQGYVIGKVGELFLIDIGLKNPVSLSENDKLKVGMLVNLEIKNENDEICYKIIKQDKIPIYWGYKVKYYAGSISRLIKNLRSNSTVIATSRLGVDYREMLNSNFFKMYADKNIISLVFGPRDDGLLKFFKDKNNFFKAFDNVINFFPNPGTKSIRLEEAIPICLSLTRLLLYLRGGPLSNQY
ncbi:MAG: putative RNA uridine N3 methyltransferase [Promethearchaeota archaeon]